MHIEIPELCLVLLVGPSASGKTTFARTHFLPTEVFSSDYCRAILADDENDQSVTNDAFEILHYLIDKRLAKGRLTVVDATNVQPASRKSLIELAKSHNVFIEAVVFDLPEEELVARHAQRTDRPFESHFIHKQRQALTKSLKFLEREGVRRVHVIHSGEEAGTATVSRTRLWTNRKEDTGPFDLIGDVHGCYDELMALLNRLGYQVSQNDGVHALSHPQGRKPVFVGDLVDRGPKTPQVVRFVRDVVKAGAALCVLGNHDVKLAKALQGRKANPTHGLAESLQQFENEDESFRKEAAEFLDSLVSHYVLDGGRLVVAHAGLPERMHGRTSGRVRGFALYGETTGERDEFGLPVRYNWAADYRGKAMVVYGHTPVVESEWLNETICLDTGCVFGGKLTALRYPERELVAVSAAREYYAPIRPLGMPEAPATEKAEAAGLLTAQQEADELLDYADVSGKRIVETRLRGRITIPEANATAALEVMSRFTADPRLVPYLPPTMSPSATSREPGLLEHPREAFDYYREQGVRTVVCEEKHMGSRAVVTVCRDMDAMRRRFGIATESAGTILTRTGRRFFDSDDLEREVLDGLREGIDRAGLWAEFDTDWFLLDCELMPWSAKSLDLLREQYAPVGAAAESMLSAASSVLEAAQARGLDVTELTHRMDARKRAIAAYRDAYGRYCWNVDGVADLRLAPFHLLASEGRVHTDRDHVWHMATLKRIAMAKPDLVMATVYRVVDLEDSASVDAAIGWWRELTEKGGEGMVVKPLAFIVTGRRGLIQPAIKCRGPEYLRIIYGPEYLLPENLERLRERGLGAKRALALKEFALGIEGLERFVRREPLRRVHECAFGVLASESEPVDPRL